MLYYFFFSPTQHKQPSTGSNLQCAHTCVKVIASDHVPSGLLHMVHLMNLHIRAEVFFGAGSSSLSSLPSSHAFARPRKALQGTSFVLPGTWRPRSHLHRLEAFLHRGCFFRVGALVFEKILFCETRGPILRNGRIQRNTVSLDRSTCKVVLLFNETVFLWIRPRIFHWKKQGFLIILNSTSTQCQVHASSPNFLFTKIGPRRVITCSRGSPEVI